MPFLRGIGQSRPLKKSWGCTVQNIRYNELYSLYRTTYRFPELRSILANPGLEWK